MRGEQRSVRLGERRDLADLGDAAGVSEVGLDDRDARLENADELLPAVQALARRDGDARRSDHLAHPVAVLGYDWLFDEHGPERYELGCEPYSRRQRNPAVEVDGHISIRAEHVARRGDAGQHAVDLTGCGQGTHPAGGVHLHRGQACVDALRDLVAYLVRLVAPTQA